jgi:predicted transcriptional regulator
MPPSAPDPVRLGDLQLAILRVLWSAGEANVAHVHAALEAARGSAFSTIATMLSKMEARGLVRHRKVGRSYVYRACIDEDSAQRAMVRDVTKRLFAGNPLELVSHLVREEEIGADDLEAIRAMIERHAARAREGDGDDDLDSVKEVG